MKKGEDEMLVTARGTSEGLMLRLDGRRPEANLAQALKDFMAVRRRFLEGQEVTLEWLGEEKESEVAHTLGEMLEREYGLTIASVRVRGPMASIRGGAVVRSEGRGALELVSPAGESSPQDLTVPTKTLFDGVESLLPSESVAEGEGAHSVPASEPLQIDLPLSGRAPYENSGLWDDPDTRTLFMTLRSGQRVDTEHSIVILGDVNSGAEVSAGGDVIVLGTLRGVAHAGAYDESGGGRVIVALTLEPTQLRIGQVITRGKREAPLRTLGARVKNSKGPEIARVDGDTIIVEPYRSRSVATRGSVA